MEYSQSFWTADNVTIALFFLVAASILIPAFFCMFIDWLNYGNHKNKIWNAQKQKWETYSSYFNRQPNPPDSSNKWKTYLDTHK